MREADERFSRELAGDLHVGTKREGGGLYLPREAFNEHAHFLGPTGVGKTRLLQHLAEQLIDAGDCCVVVLDPHDGPPPYGGLYHALKTHCYQAGQVDRLLTVDLDEIARHQLVTGFNPLHRGRSLAVRAALAAENLRSVAGISDPAAAVQLLKWAFNTFLGLHVAGLSFRDAQAILDADDATYRELIAEALRADYPHVSGDWSRLLVDDQRGRGAQSTFDFECGSTKRRIDTYLSNEYVRLMLSTQKFAFDPSQAIAERKIVLCNLSPRDLMDPHHRKMLGTQLLHAFCRAAMDRTDHESVPCYVIADEFHEFLCPEVLEILNGGRKFGIHLVLAHQFLSQLQDVAKQDWRYLDAVLQNPALRVVFGGLQWDDAERMTLEMLNQEIDLKKIKNELFGTVQTSHVEWMDLRTEMSSRASGSSWSGGTTQSSSYSQASDRVGGGFETFAQAYSAATGGNSATMTGESVALDVPVVLPDEPFQELRSVEYWGRDEQLFLLARELKNQPKQHLAVHRRGDRTQYGRVANVETPLLAISDLWGPDRDRLLALSRVPSPVVATLDVIEEERRERDRKFRQLRLAPAAVVIEEDPLPSAQELKRRLTTRRKKPPS